MFFTFLVKTLLSKVVKSFRMNTINYSSVSSALMFLEFVRVCHWSFPYSLNIQKTSRLEIDYWHEMG